MHDQQNRRNMWLTFYFSPHDFLLFFATLQEQNTATVYAQHTKLLH